MADTPPVKKTCSQIPLEHAIMELISDRDFDGYLLTHFDSRIVPEIPDTPCQTAALMYSQGRYYLRFVEDFFVGKCSEDERVAVLKHEVGHFIMHHNTRRNGRDPKLYNIAADIAINQNIQHLPSIACPLPAGWPAHDSAEVYYDKLLQAAQKQEQRGQSQCQGQSQGAGGKQQQQGQGQGQGQKNSGGQIPDQFDTVFDATDLDSSDAESIAREIVKETIKARLDAGDSESTLRGLHAGALSQYIDELTKPPIIGWKQAITRFAATLADQHSRRTLKKPDRRDIQPWGKKKEYLPRLVVAIDTSGSVSDEMLASFFSQINLLGRMLSEIAVVIADAAVHDHFVYRRGMEERLRSSGLGRGGTDFDPAVQYINDNLRDYDGAIYLTDGYCPVPSTKCRIPLIWVVTQNTDYEGRPRIMANDEGTPRRRSRW